MHTCTKELVRVLCFFWGVTERLQLFSLIACRRFFPATASPPSEPESEKSSESDDLIVMTCEDKARQDKARQSKPRHGKVTKGIDGKARKRQGIAKQGRDRVRVHFFPFFTPLLSLLILSLLSLLLTRQEKARQDMAKQAKQDKATQTTQEQHKTTQDNITQERTTTQHNTRQHNTRKDKTNFRGTRKCVPLRTPHFLYNR